MKKYILISFPYCICVIVGIVLFIIANTLTVNYNNLIIGVSGTFFAIPCLYLLYETAQKFSNRKLDNELFYYAKMQIDREVLLIVQQLITMVYTSEKRNIFSVNALRKFLTLSKNEILKQIKENEYLGFQALKDWSVSTKNITTTLENPFILQRLENEQVISIVHILNCLTNLELTYERTSDLFVVTEKKVEGYKLQAGREINEKNIKYPNRYILLKHLSEDKYVVDDFGDFPNYQVPKLLKNCKVNNTYIESYADEIFFCKSAIKDWLDKTGGGINIDPKMCRSFRLRDNKNEKKSTPI